LWCLRKKEKVYIEVGNDPLNFVAQWDTIFAARHGVPSMHGSALSNYSGSIEVSVKVYQI